MRRGTIMVVCAVCIALATPAWAQQSGSFDWEDGINTVMGADGNAHTSNSSEQANTGTRSLKFWEDPIGGTPQAFVWWVTGLTDGDTIDASFFVYDATPGASPSGRIWAHYTSDPSDILTYAGSAGGNSTYSAGTGWEQLSYSWTFDSDTGARDGFVVEVRIYSADLTTNTLYIDDSAITVSSDTAVIFAPDGSIVPVELQSFSVE